MSPELLDLLSNTTVDDLTLTNGKTVLTELPENNDFEILKSPVESLCKNSPQQFVRYYRSRFKDLQTILRSRQELRNISSISRILTKQNNESVSMVGMVNSKSITKNNNFLFSVEDLTSQITVLVSEKSDAYESAADIELDDIIGIVGKTGKKIVFADKLLLPDIPLNKEFRKSPSEEYAVFISDIHIGAEAFLKHDFEKFIDWLMGNTGSQRQKEIAGKIKYLIVAGDLVEGVGVFPNQESELLIKNIHDQYAELAKYFSKLPPKLRIILCAGNHDAGRLAEPQLPVPYEFASPLYSLPNVKFVENPSNFVIGKKNGFPGFNVLLYHGGSFIHYSDVVESIRQSGGLERVDLIAKYLLKRRHLAPAHGSTMYVPRYDSDPLMIRTIPDFFVSGHIHRATAANYRNILILNCSCWLGQTKYQEKVGLKPEPSQAFLVNLNTRDTKKLSFLSG